VLNEKVHCVGVYQLLRRSVFTVRYGLGVYIKFRSIFVSEVLGLYPSETVHLLYSTARCGLNVHKYNSG